MLSFHRNRLALDKPSLKACKSDRPVERSLRCERLESRMLLAAVVWTNRLAASDTLTAAERAVVDQALAWWNVLVVDRLQQGPLSLTVLGGGASGMNLGGNVSSLVTVETVGGGTAAATLRIDADAGGVGWYVDPQPADAQEFSTPLGAYVFSGGPPGLDLYSVVLHELAHALGFGTSQVFLGRLAPQPDGTHIYRGADGLQAILDADRGHLSSGAHPQDLLNASLAPSTRYLPSRLVVSMLADAHGYVINLPPLAAQGTFFFSAAYHVAGEADGLVQVLVHRGTGGGAAAVQYRVASGTAAPRIDYELQAGLLEFTEGEEQKSIAIRILPDGESEETEWLTIALEQPSAGAALGARAATAVYIVDRADTAWLAGLYADVLGRTGTGAELAWWQQALALGETRGKIAMGFLVSRERRSAQVDEWYRQYLGREADAGGLAWWLDVWQNQGEHAVQAGLLSSAEFFSRTAGTAQWLAELYRLLLLRAAAAHEIAWWEQRATTMGRVAVVRSFLASEEYGLLQLRAWYTSYLRREPDASGTSYWLTELRRGVGPEAVQAAILASAEYRGRYR